MVKNVAEMSVDQLRVRLAELEADKDAIARKHGYASMDAYRAQRGYMRSQSELLNELHAPENRAERDEYDAIRKELYDEDGPMRGLASCPICGKKTRSLALTDADGAACPNCWERLG